MSSPSALPIEARLIAWQRLWDRLLAAPADDPNPESDEQDNGESGADVA